MAEQQEGKKNTMLYVIIAVVAIAIIAVVLFMVFGGSSVRGETITAENYEELLKKAEAEIGKDSDDLYYLSYAMVYHMMQDGLAAAGSQEDLSESDMYKNIYGKTLNQLIDEGKQFMEENNVTIEQFKQQVKDSSSLFSY